MPPKPAAKAKATPAVGRGGAGRGQGRKAASATPAAKPAGPDPADKRVQQSLAALLGARADPPQAAAKRPAVYVADVLRWDAEEEGEKAPQKQVKEGPVRYAMESEKE